MRIGSATAGAAVAALALTLFAGCAGTVESPPTDARPRPLTTTSPWAPTESAATPRFTPAVRPSGPTALVDYVEGLPALAEVAGRAPRPSLRLRATAWREVAVIQMALNAVLSSDLDVDGHFGSNTDAAVRAFQSSRSITVDGYVGPETLRALVDALSGAGGAIPPPTFVETSPVIQPYYGLSGGTMCSDGWISTSSGSGTCSWHGGVQ